VSPEDSTPVGLELNDIHQELCPTPNATTCPLWTSWSSLLGMAGL